MHSFFISAPVAPVFFAVVIGSAACATTTETVTAATVCPEPRVSDASRRGETDGAASGPSTAASVSAGTDSATARRIDEDISFWDLKATPGTIVEVRCEETRPLRMGRGWVLGGGPYHKHADVCSAAVHAGLAEEILADRVLRIVVGGARDALLERTSQGIRGHDHGRSWPTFMFLGTDGQPLAAVPGTGPELPDVAPGTGARATHPRVLSFDRLLGVMRGMPRAALDKKLGTAAGTYRFPDGDASLTFRFADADVEFSVSATQGVTGLSISVTDGDDDRPRLASQDTDHDTAILGLPYDRVRDALGPPTTATPVELVYEFGEARLTIACEEKNGACGSLEIDWTANAEPEPEPEPDEPDAAATLDAGDEQEIGD
jgi:hypothetical protein